MSCSKERVSPLSAFSFSRSNAASWVDTRFALPFSLSATETRQRRLDVSRKISDALLPTARIA